MVIKDKISMRVIKNVILKCQLVLLFVTKLFCDFIIQCAITIVIEHNHDLKLKLLTRIIIIDLTSKLVRIDRSDRIPIEKAESTPTLVSEINKSLLL